MTKDQIIEEQGMTMALLEADLRAAQEQNRILKQEAEKWRIEAFRKYPTPEA
jgi:hypothetical protein